VKNLLIRQVQLDNQAVDVLIEGNRFKQIAPVIDAPGAPVIDGRGKAIVPPFYNAHGHAAMTLFRGFADDIDLFPWLQEHIWPAEAQLTAEDVYCAARLAIVEMIRGGTVFFNDMYWEPVSAARAAEEMGVRAAIGRLFIEERPGKVRPVVQRQTEALEAFAPQLSDRIQITYAPHAIYTVSGITLRRIGELARAAGQMIHIHAAETRAECQTCQAEQGMTPIAWLDACGILGPGTVLAHAVHLTDADVALIFERQAILAHMPISNAKLGSGQFRFQAVAETAGCRTTIGTDGCASNNNLSMFGEIKCAALSAKIQAGGPTAGLAANVWNCATRKGAEAFGIDAGVIAVGKLADAVLIDLNHPSMVPCFHLVSNLVYSADTSVVDTVICDGRVLMQDRVIPGEAEIVAAMREVSRKYAPMALDPPVG
jgi:5-methylthioadenosine/S-adenosylhomocysteine deaminase